MQSSFVISEWEASWLFERLREQARSHRGLRWMRLFRLMLVKVGEPWGDGHFSVVAPASIKENPPVLLVATQYLEWADHAE